MNMKLITLAGAVAALVATSNTVSADTFRYGSFVPERSSANQKGVFPLMERIAKATDNRVTFNRMVGGTVLSAPASFKGVQDAVVDAAFVVTQFHPSELPYGSLLAEFTGFGTNTFAALGALNEAYFVTCEKCREDFAKQGVMPLFIQGATPLTMACTKPVSGADDLKGLRLSSIGTPEMRWGAMLGMTPRRQNFSDAVQALQLGQVDCWAATVAWIRSYGQMDTIKGVIEMPQGVIVGAVPMLFNKRAWDKVSAADKATIRDNMAVWLRDYVHGAYVEDDADVKKLLQEKGVAFAPGDDAMKEKWQEFQAAEIAALTELAKRRNLENGEQLVKEIAAVFEKWHTEHLPKFENDPDAFAKLLHEEVFSKIEY